MKKYILFFIAVFFIGCHSREIGFVYTPVSPRAGQAITFRNTSETGDTWSWNFGDGTSSALKSPTKTYSQAGEYTVTLKVDDKKSLTYSTTIVVGDTLPVIELTDTMPEIYKKVSCSISCYNPNNLKIKYLWLLSDNAVLCGESAQLTDSIIEIYFTEPDEAEIIEAVITLGSQVDTVGKIIEVKDILAPSLILNTTEQTIVRQRLFDNELGSSMEYDAVLSANHLEPYNDNILAYTAEGMMMINTDKSALVITSGKPLVAGTILRDTVYWKSADDKPHCVPAGMLSVSQAIASGADNEMTGLYADNDYAVAATYMCHDGSSLCFAGKGCLIAGDNFAEDMNINALAIDRVNGKIYFIDADKSTLSVVNIGAGLAGMAELTSCNGNQLIIDYKSDRIFYTSDDSLYSLPLLHTIGNTSISVPALLRAGVKTFTLDTRLIDNF